MGTFHLIIIILLFGGLITAGALYFANKVQNLKQFSKEQEDQLSMELERLKQRIEVLEKIITDKNYRLNEDINNL